MSETIFRLWSELESTRRMEDEMRVDPWESNSEKVKEIWEELSDPKMLDDLLDWQRSNSPLNPVAQRLVSRAIAIAQGGKV